MSYGRHRRAPITGRHRKPTRPVRPPQRTLVVTAVSLLVAAMAAQIPLHTATAVQKDALVITAPTDGSTVEGVTSLDAELITWASDVTWSVDGVAIATVTSAPWSVDWDSQTVSDGAHQISAEANVHGVKDAIAAPVTVMVSNASTPSRTPTPTPSPTPTETSPSPTPATKSPSPTPTETSPSPTPTTSSPAPTPTESSPTPTPTATSPSPTPSSSSPTSAGPCVGASAPATYAHIVWIVFENKSGSSILGNSEAPYLNSLAAQCGSATNMFAETHPSLPNYLAMTSGSTYGITDDDGPSTHPISAANIFSEVGDSLKKKKSMPSPCATADSGDYRVKHNPPPYYTDLSASCPTRDVPMSTSSPDVSAVFTFITPNICNDMHDCSVATGDQWLSGVLPRILSSSEYAGGRTAIFITWDEGDVDNHIATLVIAPSVQPGTSVATAFTHYSMLRATEEMLGLPSLLGAAATAVSMRLPFGL